MTTQTKATKPDFAKVLGAFQKNKVLSTGVTLEQLAAASREIGEISSGIELAAWTFISPNYVYTGDSEPKILELEDRVK